jgi:hypothetical protein
LHTLDLDAVETEADDATGVLVLRRGGTTIVFNFSDQERDGVAPWDFRVSS